MILSSSHPHKTSRSFFLYSSILRSRIGRITGDITSCVRSFRYREPTSCTKASTYTRARVYSRAHKQLLVVLLWWADDSFFVSFAFLFFNISLISLCFSFFFFFLSFLLPFLFLDHSRLSPDSGLPGHRLEKSFEFSPDSQPPPSENSLFLFYKETRVHRHARTYAYSFSFPLISNEYTSEFLFLSFFLFLFYLSYMFLV